VGERNCTEQEMRDAAPMIRELRKVPPERRVAALTLAIHCFVNPEAREFLFDGYDRRTERLTNG